MSKFRGSFIPSVLCLVLVSQPQEGLSRNYEQRILDNKAGHAVRVFKNILNENQVSLKCSLNSKSFRLPFSIVLWNILDIISKISSDIEKFIWKILLKLSYNMETK